MTDRLHTYRYGPSRPAQILGVHGLTGHGRRWETLSNEYLPEFSVLAPDLIGLIQRSYTPGSRDNVFDLDGVRAGISSGSATSRCCAQGPRKQSRAGATRCPSTATARWPQYRS